MENMTLEVSVKRVFIRPVGDRPAALLRSEPPLLRRERPVGPWWRQLHRHGLRLIAGFAIGFHLLRHGLHLRRFGMASSHEATTSSTFSKISPPIRFALVNLGTAVGGSILVPWRQKARTAHAALAIAGDPFSSTRASNLVFVHGTLFARRMRKSAT